MVFKDRKAFLQEDGSRARHFLAAVLYIGNFDFAIFTSCEVSVYVRIWIPRCRASSIFK
jgi:hypothetical protein